MVKQIFLALVLADVMLASAQTGSGASALTERDFLNDMPIVLSVSRLAQPLNEAPGAVTILDRNFIRMSGARDVTDLLRLVPGFQTTTSFETDAPMATYHGRNDDWANRIQVLVDGRSVYSAYLQGSAGLGLQTLAMEDIERIEILRGSNSASYGARAFLGVINIVSRDVRETEGVFAAVTSGDNGIHDKAARIGWGTPQAMYRISADTRADAGLRGAYGENTIARANFVAHLLSEGPDEFEVRFGGLDIDAGRGDVNDHAGNAARMRSMGSRFLQLDWHRVLADDQDISVTASHTENTFSDHFPYLSYGAGPLYYGIDIDFSGTEFNDAMTLQHTKRISPALRVVWGVEVRRELVVSRPTFDVREQVLTDFSRLFANAEWRLTPNVILNAGGMAENSSIDGGSFSPRLMLNWHAVEGHTVRVGVSTAFRPPNAFEKYANVKYYDVNGANPITTVQSSGQVTAEHIESRELGYNLSAPGLSLSGDLRVFNERVTDGIATPFDVSPSDSRNLDNYTIQGAEYQIKWQPSAATQVFFSQTVTDVSGVQPSAVRDDNHLYRVKYGVPELAGSLAIMHTLDSGLELSAMYNRTNDVALMSTNGRLYSMERTDLRVGKTFKMGRNKTELALTLQNLNAPYQDGDSKFYFDQRAMVTVRVHY